MAVLKSALILLIVGYAAVVAVLYVYQRSIMYPAPQIVRTAPAEAGFPRAEEHMLDTADGERVIVWHVPPQPGKPVILFLHGNGEVLAWRVPRFSEIVADGTGLIALSFRGYGGSSGSPSESGLLADGAAAYRFAASRYPVRQLALWGYSLGSGVAVALAAEHPVGALILEAPYSSTVELAAAAFPWLPVRWLLHDQFRSDLRIAAVRAPLLIMHGEQDTVISFAFGERLLALAHEPKRMVRFPRGDHINLDEQGAVAAVKTFLARLE